MKTSNKLIINRLHISKDPEIGGKNTSTEESSVYFFNFVNDNVKYRTCRNYRAGVTI